MQAKSLYDLRDSNIRKTWFLIGLFSLIVIGVSWIVSVYYGSPVILYGAVLFSLIMNLVSYWKSDKIALSLSGAIPARKGDYPELYRIVENLSISMGLPMPKIYIIPDETPNAFATGRDPKHASVAVTEGLLQMMDKSELEGVLAHELSHIKNYDILVMTVAVVLVGFLSILSDFVLRSFFFSRENKNSNPVVLALVVFALIVAPIVGQLMQLAVSRKREYLADASGALATRYPEGLARALEKIASYSKPMTHASHATAHLFISNPFGADREEKQSFFKKLEEYLSTHPPIEKRIKALRELEIE